MSYPPRSVLAMGNTGACPARVVLSQAEFDVVDALPDGAHQVERELSCEIEAGHPGPHTALAQAYGQPERERWLQWDDSGTRTWADIGDSEHCQAEGPPIKRMIDNELCVLPEDHWGRHSFEFGALA